MTQQSVEENPSAPTISGDRDVQRAALRDLVKLSADSAAEESRIEQIHQDQIRAADKQLQNSLEEISQQHQTQKEQINTESEELFAKISKDYATAQNEIKIYTSAARQRIDYENDAVDQDLRGKLQQTIWLAESVFEATQNQIAKEYAKAKEEHGNRIEELDKIASQMTAVLTLYGQPTLAATVEPTPIEGDAGPYETHRDQVLSYLKKLEHLAVPRLFVGIRPFIAVVVICIIAMFVTQWITGGLPIDYGTFEIKAKPVSYALGGSLIFCILAGVGLWMLGKSQVRAAYIPLRQSLDAVRFSADAIREAARAERDAQTARATKKRDLEVHAAKDKVAPYQARAVKNRQAAIHSAQEEHKMRVGRVDEQHRIAVAHADQLLKKNLEKIDQARDRDVAAANKQHGDLIQRSKNQFETSRADLQKSWTSGLTRIQTPIEQNMHGSDSRALVDWNDPRWKSFSPPKKFPSRIRFGELQVDLKQITDNYPRELALPPTFSVPATLTFPDRGSLLIHTDHAGHAEAIHTQQMVMARLLTQLPPGRVRFTIIDPVGLGQNFAGFMHLTDHDEALVGTRIWTETEHIEQQLANLTEHMETVIQKYLRNEFATIDEYNAQAGELAEPYRYLVIADFPVGFEGDAFRRLNSIATSGARCGVFTLIVRDTRKQIPGGVHLDELESHSVNLVRKDDHFLWKDEIFKQFPLTLDPPPGEEFLTEILDIVGRGAKEAKRVEVAFAAIAPPENQMWSSSSKDDLQVPIGRLGATRLQMMKLGRGVAQHAIIAGKTGSGKSTLLHVLVTNLALWYGPDDVEFYLVDFKKGVEFKTYATHMLPHARAIAVESDREFGLSVLHRIDAELARRGEMFRKLGVQDLAAYRSESKQPLPRTLLIIDEFQEFFSEDDKLAQEASLLLDRLVRQGRAFGIHVLLGSQTIGGTSGLARSTIGQMAVRIALQTSEADSQLILGDANSAARLLSRPGEAIYNDAGGLVEANSPFQISWLPDAEREVYLDRIREKSKQSHNVHAEPIVFEGNSAADIARNKRLASLIDAAAWSAAVNAPLMWLGEPVAIKEPTAITMRRQSGSNVLIIGQQEESAMAITAASMISLAVQHKPGSAKFYLLDGTPADSSLAGTLPQVISSMSHDVKNIEWREIGETIATIAEEMQKRQTAEHSDQPAIYLVIYGLQRYRMLRRSEESFSYSMDDAAKAPQPDKLFADILREGPALGIHVITWVDTPASIERTLERGTMREFDNRVLFQMSAADSSNLIDSPTANKLGFHRALLFSEERGVMEKFRPYALPTKSWLEHLGAQLKNRK
jgi:S-DNA-T family DNA segregation ATPase FtsK/SpoIIIE